MYKIDHDWVWVALSRDVKAQLFILDSSCQPSELADFQQRFYIGKALSGHVVGMNKEKKLLRLVLHAPTHGSMTLKENISDNRLPGHLVEGSIVGGRISKVLPGVGGLMVQIDPHHYGKVHFTELKDKWVSNPLSGYEEGKFVKCKILEINRTAKGTFQVDLSLRSSSDTLHGLNV